MDQQSGTSTIQDEQVIAKAGSRSGGASCCRGPEGVIYEGGSVSNTNLNQIERVLSVVGGAWLLKRNFGRFSLAGLLKSIAGGALLKRGLSGHCDIYEAMNVSSANASQESHPGASETAKTIKAAINVQMPPFETYRMWRDPSNQSWIFGHFARLENISVDRAHWMLRSPVGMKLEWDALIVADSPGEFISWETLPGAGIPNEGTVRFLPTETGGTRLIYEMRFDPPAGALGIGLMKLFGVTPQSVITKALSRFKNMAEMGLPKPPMEPHQAIAPPPRGAVPAGMER